MAYQLTKLQLIIDAATDEIIGDIAKLGIHGTSKAEVACSIIRMWIWDNERRLRVNGIALNRKRSYMNTPNG